MFSPTRQVFGLQWIRSLTMRVVVTSTKFRDVLTDKLEISVDTNICFVDKTFSEVNDPFFSIVNF